MNNINNFRNKEEKNLNILNNDKKEENNNNEGKSYIPAPRTRYALRINNLKNNIINNDINETEKNNNEKRVIRCESYKSSLLKVKR